MASEKTRLRIRFSKRGDLRWISHRDLARVWERLLRRAKLELAFSEGFHPKPKINFPSALALGVEALDEIVELEVLGTIDVAKAETDIRAETPDGMTILSIESPDYGLGKARVSAASYNVTIPDEHFEGLAERIEQLLTQETIEIEREKRTVTCRTDDPHFDLHLSDRLLTFTIPNQQDGSMRPSELLDRLGLAGLLEEGHVLVREKVHLQEPQPKHT